MPVMPRSCKYAACRHCGGGPVNRPRGLCWHCYNTPGVRGQYAPVNKFGRRGVGNCLRRPPRRPASPTSAPPGSEEKVAVLAERARRHERLFHPDDAPIED